MYRKRFNDWTRKRDLLEAWWWQKQGQSLSPEEEEAERRKQARHRGGVGTTGIQEKHTQRDKIADEYAKALGIQKDQNVYNMTHKILSHNENFPLLVGELKRILKQNSNLEPKEIITLFPWEFAKLYGFDIPENQPLVDPSVNVFFKQWEQQQNQQQQPGQQTGTAPGAAPQVPPGGQGKKTQLQGQQQQAAQGQPTASSRLQRIKQDPGTKNDVVHNLHAFLGRKKLHPATYQAIKDIIGFLEQP